MSRERQCWYCGEPAIEVWHTTWDEPGVDWPMCGTCSSNVRQALDHRAEGCDEAADELDERSGISTDKNCGQWIPPETKRLTDAEIGDDCDRYYMENVVNAGLLDV